MAEERDQECIPDDLEHKVDRLLSPFQSFIKDQTTGALFLIVCTVAALALANSPLAADYLSLIHTKVGLYFADTVLEMSVRHWINEGLMALFFFVLGLEIKRELLAGELKDPRQSLPVIFAAIGGMVLPAAIFVAFTWGTPAVHGWGIPMATDAAFAVGVLALLGSRIPYALTAFLTALAIIDDLGAIAVIAIFYSSDISLEYLGAAGAVFAVLLLCNRFGCRRPLVYVIGGALVWLAMLGSGVHATVAGVLLAIAVPARPKCGPYWFVGRTRDLVRRFEKKEEETRERPILAEEEEHALAESIQESAQVATTPLQRWERSLEHPVALFVMPVFALVNAGIVVNADTLAAVASEPFALGVACGLLFGKSIGITFMTWLALRLGLGELSPDIDLGHIFGIGLVGGIGFTMSIFIAGLSFAEDSSALVLSKAAILSASLIAGVAGYLWLRLRGAPRTGTEPEPA